MVRKILSKFLKILNCILCTIGLLWCIVELYWFEPLNYRVFYLPNIDAFVCTRIVESGYEDIDKYYLDLSFGDSVESVLHTNPWKSDIIRFPVHHCMDSHFGIRGSEKDTIYVNGNISHQFINNKKEKQFVWIDALDFKSSIHEPGGKPKDGCSLYWVTCDPSAKAKNIRILSLNENEDIQEIKTLPHR